VSDVLTLAVAAPDLGMSPRKAYRLAKAGEFPIPVVKIGGRYIVSKAAVDAYLASLEWKPEAAAT
jgi:excisionase family DNA binding protein